MKIVIKETSVNETLELIDYHTKLDCASDIIGNYGGLSDGQFTYDADLNAYHCKQETFDWWQRVLADQQQVNDRIGVLSDEYGADVVHNAIGQAGDCDLEDQAAAINNALDDAHLGE